MNTDGERLVGAYKHGTAGWAGTDTSRERAFSERDSGELSDRLERVLQMVRNSHGTGLTWKEIASQTHLHHGQVSGALSNLHKQGLVFITKSGKRDRCHVYYHRDCAWAFESSDRIDQPQVSSTKQRQATLEELVHLVEAVFPRTLFDGRSLDVHSARELESQIVELLDRLND